MLKSKKFLIPFIAVVALICVFGIILLIDSLSPAVSKEEWQSTPELALKREVEYGAENIGTAKTEDVLSVALMLDKLEFADTNTLYAIFLSKADIFTIAKLTKDAATGKWKYHSTLFYEKDLANSTCIYNAQNPDRTLTKDHFKDAENGYILGLKFRDGATVRVNNTPAKMKTYGFQINGTDYSLDLWYVSENIPEEDLCIQYKSR
ncbi:MAG: hypothetical protein E7624_07845 [Ruminococcaceae bacterium]|nr:hypothetical protein [Oscillospiraceae bacterium]